VDPHDDTTVRLQLVGGGKMGEALVGGLLDAGWATTAELRVVERLDARRKELTDRFTGLSVTDTVGPAEGTLLAVKPADIEAACAEVAAAGSARVLSIAAGVTLDRLERALGGDVPVVRAMPNTPALVRAGASAIAGGASAGEADLDWAEEVLASVGVVVRVGEDLLDAVTGLSGSGPAYVFLVTESLIEAGVLAGLPRPVAELLARQTLMGSARLLLESGDDEAALRAAVTSPGGTTAAGLRVLEREGVRSAMLDAVEAATRRSRELGQH
jgi:pyrroline-5-carboxylate reductase